MGQHFLKNPYVLRKIIDYISPRKNDLIIEIGAGKGALTLPLAHKAGKVIAIEKDKNLIPFLQKKNISNLKILTQDALKIDYTELIRSELNFEGNVKVVGNLPYSISSPLLFKIFAEKELISECVFLFQKEVAERVCAGPGTKKYAPLSILFQNYFSTKQCLTVKPKSFSPPPQVNSALISLKKRDTPLFHIKKEENFHKFLKEAFQHRRKTLFNNLVMRNYSASLLEEAFCRFGLEKNIRSEQLSVSQFVELFYFFGS